MCIIVALLSSCKSSSICCGIVKRVILSLVKHIIVSTHTSLASVEHILHKTQIWVTRCFHTEALSGKSDQRYTQDTKDDQEQIVDAYIVEQALWNACSPALWPLQIHI